MAKLYPPDIGGIIPAFYGDEIKVPFTMNRLVNINEVIAVKLIIKTITNGKLLKELTSEIYQNGVAIFSKALKESEEEYMFPGQYYKVQMAFVAKDDTIGYYSNVAVLKYTTEPSVKIVSDNGIDSVFDNYTFIGEYSQTHYNEETEEITYGDLTEKVYSYRFDIYNEDNEIEITSGDLLHNSQEDIDKGISRDIFELDKELSIDKKYKIQYTITTNNKMIVSSELVEINFIDSVDSTLEVNLIAKNNFDNGYISLSLEKLSDNDLFAYGSFVIKRACSKDKYITWQLINTFQLTNSQIDTWNWKDMTTEQGYSYIYALQQYSDNLYSNKILSKEIYSDFEDMFLYDGNKCLKIRFNPKMSSFKNTILETKTNTIGGKYPFFYRNGSVYYKEFPISGLLSYLSDTENLFISQEELFLENYTTNLIGENIAAEKIFKLKALEWLSNGEAKIFKSPGEGNYIVRLSNISLAPNDTVGRMLHTFSATASEIADYSYKNLKEYKFIDTDYKNEIQTCWETVNLFNESAATAYPIGTELLLHSPIKAFTIEGAPAGAQLSLDGMVISIGASGMYQVELKDELSFNSVQIAGDNINSGILTYAYEAPVDLSFSEISGISLSDYHFEQFIGYKENIVPEIEEAFIYNDDSYKTGLKNQLVNLKYFQAKPREIITIFKGNDGNYYYDSDKINIINSIDLIDPVKLYKVVSIDTNPLELYEIVNTNGSIYYANPQDLNTPLPENNFYSFIIDDNPEIDVRNTENYEIFWNKDCYYFSIGAGVYLDCIYLTKEIEYRGENNLISKDEYENSKIAYDNLLDSWENDTNEIFDIGTALSNQTQIFNNIKNSYLNYQKELYEFLLSQRAGMGVI